MKLMFFVLSLAIAFNSFLVVMKIRMVIVLLGGLKLEML
ncbi:hypothetical protein Xszus_01886 [Xenorhabdus szentirmaii]|nr:hypothetical protein Xsze_02157 [Xenorhabdus szentirmaii DSM 16338]PHM42156.1 hypothetical protein Xszus_01886 [Xenorhabdus szentirmaii]